MGRRDHDADRRQREKWPARLGMYPRMVDLAMLHLDGSGLPDSDTVAKRLKISRSKFYKNWRDPMEWIHGELTTMVSSAEGQFKAALRDEQTR